jgi:hypothetical protein
MKLHDALQRKSSISLAAKKLPETALLENQENSQRSVSFTETNEILSKTKNPLLFLVCADIFQYQLISIKLFH